MTQARHARQQVYVKVPSMGGNTTVKKGTPKPVNLTASKVVFDSTTNFQHPMQGNKLSTLILFCNITLGQPIFMGWCTSR